LDVLHVDVVSNGKSAVFNDRERWRVMVTAQTGTNANVAALLQSKW
jgi:hypothetical protein